MTVFIHKDMDAVSFGEHEHLREHAPEGQGDERTWALTCSAECEERVLRDMEHSSRHPGGVPLTVAEKAEAEAFDRAAQKDVSKMAMALAQMAKEQITASA